jgi:hypothetical protein
MEAAADSAASNGPQAVCLRVAGSTAMLGRPADMACQQPAAAAAWEQLEAEAAAGGEQPAVATATAVVGATATAAAAAAMQQDEAFTYGELLPRGSQPQLMLQETSSKGCRSTQQLSRPAATSHLKTGQ